MLIKNVLRCIVHCLLWNKLNFNFIIAYFTFFLFTMVKKKPLLFYDLYVFVNAWYPTTVACEQSGDSERQHIVY